VLPSKVPGYTIAVGLERGWFFQVFDNSTIDEYGSPFIDEDNVSRSRMCDLIDEHCDTSAEVVKYVQESIAIDVDPNYIKYRSLISK
jgi:hypothetical protein